MLPHYLQGGSNPTNKTEEEKEGTRSGTKESGNIFALSDCMAGVGKTIQSRLCTTVWQHKHKRPSNKCRSTTVWQGATLV